jgi:hypothetical protein
MMIRGLKSVGSASLSPFLYWYRYIRESAAGSRIYFNRVVLYIYRITLQKDERKEAIPATQSLVSARFF